MDVFLGMFARMNIFRLFSTIFGAISVDFQNAADLVFGQSDTVLFKLLFQHSTTKAAMVFDKYIDDHLAFFCLVFRAAGTVPPHIVVR